MSFSRSVWFSTGSCMSMRAAMAALEATARAILPLCQRGARCTRACWNIRPCLGGCEPVFMERKRAFSAPSTWIVLAAMRASFRRLPALASRRAPTPAPSIADRFGAARAICASTCSSRSRRAWYMSRTCLAIPCIMFRFSSVISPPRLVLATRPSMSALASGKPASRKVDLSIPSRRPARATRQ